MVVVGREETTLVGLKRERSVEANNYVLHATQAHTHTCAQNAVMNARARKPVGLPTKKK